MVACGPGESEKKVPSENSETPPESALIGTRTAGPREIDDVTEHPPESVLAGTSSERESQRVTFTVPVEHPLESGAAGTSCDGEIKSVTFTVPSEQPPEFGGAGHGESEHPPKSPIPGSSSGGAAVVDVEVEEEDQWLFSLTRRLNALGPVPYKLPEGWQDFDEVSYALMINDALCAVGLVPEDLPSEWAAVVTKKTKKKKEKMLKLPKVPHLFLGKMYKRSSGPADDEEWEIDIYRHCCNLRADNNWKFTDILDKLPPIPVDDIMDVETQKPPSVSDDEAWTHDIYRRHRNLRARFDVPTKKEILESRELRQNLPVDEFGLPELPSHDATFELEERFQRLKTNPVTPSGDRLPFEFLSGYVDMSKVLDPAHHLDSKRKEKKKTRKKATKRLDREAQMHLAEAKKLMEEA